MLYLAIVVVLGVLIFVHELGHYLAAKAVGIGVPRFSIGLGPITPLRWRRGETEYVISWIPFGGYVKMASKEEQDDVEALEGGRTEQDFPPEKLFESKSVPARIFVLSAGVVMNALFAWWAFTLLAFVYGGAETPITQLGRVDVEVLPEAARELAELPLGADVERVNGEPVATWDDILDQVLDPMSESLRFEFAGTVAPVDVAVPGIDMETRGRIALALRPFVEPRVGSVVAGSPAEAAGFRPGDLIVEIDGLAIGSWDQLVDAVKDRAGEELALVALRDGERIAASMTPVEEIDRDPLTREARRDPETGEPVMVARIGIGQRLPEPVYERFGPGAAIVEGARQTWDVAALVLFSLKGMVVGDISVRELGGPVVIADASAQAARAGLRYLLWFMAFLSVNLAVLNLLPIPVLDGGHLVFLAIEGVRRRPVSKELRLRLTNIGLYFLLALTIFVVVNDVLRLTGR